ncbi:MAG: UDP-N-acetylmuramoyl-tripeptide--D-alanyl-D-alanine ligase [Acidobacteriota bacterium]|nr:MAG: UDP-N-acetylmuramoyl-tripeptide--D-alanyl-D-alanine ligase [Acidobacteriota bacterium]
MNAAPASAFNPALLDIEVNSFATDSREVKAGDLFFAFSQPEFANNCFNGDFQDATRFVPSAFERGAAASVIRKDRFEEHRADLQPFEDRLIFADDVIAAFQALAREVYKGWGRPVVAVTGSAGKTTAKELTAHVLGHSGLRILRNMKNLNNGVGHPMTVLQLASEREFDAAVLEMGMSTPNREIARLCTITPPDVAIELNVLPVHIEHLGTIERIRDAKAELVEGLKPGGTAILNADDPLVIGMRERHRGKTVTYGIDNPADVSASDLEMKRFGETSFTLRTPDGEARVALALSGKHNVLNALAASAAGHCFGMSPDKIAEALGTVAPPPQRGEVIRFAEGFTVINDSYNSNPDALMKMVATLVEGAPEDSRKIVVAGEMLELGNEEAAIHRKAGRQLAKAGIDKLIGVRGLASEMVEAAREAGLEDASFTEDSETAGGIVSGLVREGDVVLVKGSRGVRTERVIERLLAEHGRSAG